MAKKLFFVAAIAALSLTSTLSFAQDLVQWRGPERTGIYPATGLLKTWPAEGPKVLWSYEGLGKGFSSVIVAGKKIYTTGQTESKGTLFAFDLQGKLLWKVDYGKDWNESFPGTRTTPTYYKGNLYLLTAFGDAICFNAETGKKIWNVDLKAKFGPSSPTWGLVESPLVDETKVYFSPGTTTTSMVALNRLTGETVWKSASIGEVPSYNTPTFYTYKNKKYIVAALSKSLYAVDASDGTLLWKTPQVSGNTINPNTPIYKDGQIFSTTGYKGGSLLLKLSDDGKSVTQVWHNATLDSQTGGAVWVGNYMVGSGQNDKSWQALDSKTGNVAFQTTELGRGAVISADGLLYFYADNGELGLVELTDKGFAVKSKFKITLGTDQHWAHPVIDNGVLYVRHGNALIAYSIKK
jgi:outer membrane protein assembly factor BamB